VVALKPRGTPEMGFWERIHEQCLGVLRGCILPAKDVILPALAASGPAETFLIVASADAHGAEVLTRRIAGQLERAPELRASICLEVSSIPIELPLADRAQPVEKLAQQVADVVTAMVEQALRQPPTANGKGSMV
jgi:hypothetical protein